MGAGRSVFEAHTVHTPGTTTSVTDGGFSPGGCANSQNCYFFLIFDEICIKLKYFAAPGGGHVPCAPTLYLPMDFVTVQWVDFDMGDIIGSP